MGVKALKKYQERAVSSLKELPEDKLRLLLDFIEYLKDRDEWEATWEIMFNNKMMADIKAANADWKAGRREMFIPWEKIRRNV